MKKVVKWAGIVFGVLVGIIGLAMVVIYALSSARINQTYDVPADDIVIPDDEASIARGEHLVNAIVDCTGCHGEDLSGQTMIDDPMFGLLTSSNLTSGEGGVGGTFKDEDWLRAVRHGVRPDGSPLLFMPAHEFNSLSAEDVGAIIAYVKTVPPVDNVPADDKAGPLARAMFLTGQLPLLPAELIDHDLPPTHSVEASVTAEYGEYLTRVCTGCHGPNLTGGPITGAPPGTPPAYNLTPDESGLAGWTEEDFFRVIREGIDPDGQAVDPIMPWMTFRNLEDDEIRAIWLYLQSLDPLPTGS